MPRPTFSKYLSHLRAKPASQGWGALLVYDRFRANRLLAQEHIQRLDNSGWLPRISFKKDSEDNSWTEGFDLVLDKPLLSFVNSTISGSKALLSMNVISGVLTQLRQGSGGGQPEVIAYSVVNPLNGPAVRIEILLNDTDGGNIDTEGRVTLDLSKGLGYTFEVDGWGELNMKLGEAIKLEFEKWDEADRVWELNVIKRIEGEVNPIRFAVRTHSMKNAKDINAVSEEEQGEGAVLVGVAFDEDTVGTWPSADGDMPYLLPSPENTDEDPYTMSIIFHNELWVRSGFWNMVATIPGVSNILVEKDQHDFYSTLKSDVQLHSPGYTDHTIRRYGDYNFTTYRWPDLDFSGNFRIVHTDDVFSIDWTVISDTKEMVVIFNGPSGDRRHDPDFNITISVRTKLKISIVGSGDRFGEVEVQPGPVEVEYEMSAWGGESSYINNHVITAFDDYIKPHVQSAVDELSTKIAGIAAAVKPVNVLRLNSLLFRSDDIATPRVLVTPGDLAMLGDLAPRLTSFAVEPLEAKVSAAPGKTVTFHVEPAVVGEVAWSVQGLPGDSGNVGSITQGVYTPPDIGSLTDGYKRVIVTATANGNSSSAVVTVVADSVAVYPLYKVAQFSQDQTSRRYVLTGGDIAGELRWEMTSGSKGTIREAEDGDSDLVIPVDKNVRIYVSPPRLPGAGPIASRVHVDGVEVSAGGQKQTIDIILPWTTTSGMIKTTKQRELAFKLVLAYYDSDAQEEIELTPAETTWEVLKGTGTLDPATGIYTAGPDEGPYIIVAACENPAPRLAIWSFSAIPVSRFDDYQAFVEHVRIHSGQRKD